MPIFPEALPRPVAAALAAALLTACGGDPSPNPTPDGGAGGNARLRVNEPPGESLGLSFGGSQTLSVTYEDASGEPSPGEEIEFRMLESGSESTGGSTLSSNRVVTDERGVAEVTLVAGAERVDFRVEASAPDAPSAIFFIAVSEEGFTDLIVTAEYDGFRSAAELLPINFRLYRASDHSCAEIDLDAIPDSIFPELEVEALGDAASFINRSSGQSYTLLGWGEGSDGGPPLAAACIDLGAEKVRPGQTVGLELMLSDRSARLPEEVALRTRFDLALLGEALEDAGVSQVWEELAFCKAGPGQLLLDCAQSALSGETNCEPGGEHALIDAIEEERGEPDEDGCRPLELEGGDPSLDKRIADAIDPEEFPTGDPLADIAVIREELLADVDITSRLSFPSRDLARHSLEAMELGAEGEPPHTVDLRESARSLITAEGIPVELSSPGGGQLSIGQHGFTARLGSAAATAFRVLALEPAGLADDAGALGSALAAAADDPVAATEGCEAVSTLVCDAIGEDPACLEIECEQGASELDAELAAWAELVDGSAIDLSLSGSAPATDDAGDLVTDRIDVTPGGEPAGSWAGTLVLRDGTPVDLVGSFRGELE